MCHAQTETRLHAAQDQLRRDMLEAKVNAENALRSAAVATSEKAALAAQVDALNERLSSMQTVVAEARREAAQAAHAEAQLRAELSAVRRQQPQQGDAGSVTRSPTTRATRSAAGFASQSVVQSSTTTTTTATTGGGGARTSTLDAATAAAFAALHAENQGLKAELRRALGVGLSAESQDGADRDGAGAAASGDEVRLLSPVPVAAVRLARASRVCLLGGCGRLAWVGRWRRSCGLCGCGATSWRGTCADRRP